MLLDQRRSESIRQIGIAVLACLISAVAHAQGAPDHPTITFQGHPVTPRSILSRNMGSPEDQTTAFPPHKVIANIYYVGPKTLSTFLIVTPQGNILMDSTYERNVRTIQKSVEQLGFKFADTKILLGNHAHGDHMEGDSLVKELTGAQVIALAEDVPALRAMKPGGKEHPIDKIIHDGDSVALGGVTLIAHWTPGHTHGATTWSMKATEGGKSYDVVFYSSLRSPAKLTPELVNEFNHSFATVRSIPCDVPLGDHGGEYFMQEKFAKIKSGGPNPFIDPAGCNTEADIEDAMFHAILEEQNSTH
jgi:metallo-beta-lactamase class B